MYSTIEISPLDLLLDESNPRFLTNKKEKKDQHSIIQYLIKFEGILQLAEEINNFGGLIPGERILVIKEDNKYIVLEGNRRTTAMNLLLKPQILTNIQKGLNIKKFPVINEKCKNNIKKIQVDLVNDRDIANYSLYRRHIDGIKKWSQISKMYFYKNLLEQGHNIKYLMELTSENRGEIIKTLNGYSIIRIIVDNYTTYFPASNYILDKGEAFLETELLGLRLLPFYKRILGISFSKNNYELIPLHNEVLHNKLIQIFVSIAHLYWESNGINTRILNKKDDTDNFFTEYKIDKQEQNRIVDLIQEFINLKTALTIENDLFTDLDFPNYENSNVPSDVGGPNDSKEPITSGGPNDSEAPITSGGPNDSEAPITSGGPNDSEAPITSGGPNDSEAPITSGGPNDSEAPITSGGPSDSEAPITSGGPSGNPQIQGRPRKKPEEFDYLLKSYPFKNKYIKNKRINQILEEMNNVNYKNNTVSSMFLIRTLLETYVNEYINHFAGLDRNDSLKLKNISPDRNKRTKTLRLLIFEDIYNHLKNVLEKYAETYELIQAIFTDNNNTSTMQIIHFYVHSSESYPDSMEILDAWKKTSQIIITLDELLFIYTGQNN